MVQECAERWALKIAAPVHGTTYGYVAPGMRDGAEVVLKVAPPWMPDFLGEESSLRWYSGNGAVRLLDSDICTGALLLERAVPGGPLTGLVRQGRDDEATLVIADVMRRLWLRRPGPGDFIDLPLIQEDTDALARLRIAIPEPLVPSLRSSSTRPRHSLRNFCSRHPGR